MTPAYFIMTKDGWRPLPIIVDLGAPPFHNPFKGYQDHGHATYVEWISK